MENNTNTGEDALFTFTTEEDNDVKVLAMSYLMYKIGKHYSKLNLHESIWVLWKYRVFDFFLMKMDSVEFYRM